MKKTPFEQYIEYLTQLLEKSGKPVGLNLVSRTLKIAIEMADPFLKQERQQKQKL